MLAYSSEECSCDAGVASGTQAALDVVLDALVAMEIPIDEIRRLFRREAELLRQSVWCLSVDDTEVHGLRAFALFRFDSFDRQSQNFRRRSAMNVLACRKRRNHAFVARQVSDDSQFNLRV